MKVLSFDVGIKNLAACILEWNETPNPKENLKIHYWTIINLLTSHTNTEEIINNYKCCGKDSKKKDCDKKSKSYVEFNSIKYCFCTKHLSSKDELIEPILAKYDENEWYKEKNRLCTMCSVEQSAQTVPITESIIESIIESITEPITNPNKKMITDRKTYCINDKLDIVCCSKHYNSLMGKVTTAKNKVSPIKSKKVKDMTSDDLKFHLVKCLDERKDNLLQTDMVLIENQPTFKNPTMKAISDTLYTWFMIRGVVDKNINNSTIQKIKFISPSNKLKEFDQKTIENADESKKYKETKKLSIENTKTILQSYDLKQWIDEIMKYQKKDDLADSFLQGWYVLNNTNEDKLYIEWKKLYDETVFKVSDLVEEKKAKKKGLKINLTNKYELNELDETNKIIPNEIIDLTINSLETISKTSKSVSKTSKAKLNKSNKLTKSIELNV